MTKKKLYYFVSFLILAIPLLMYFFSLIHCSDSQILLTIPSNFFTFSISDNSFFFVSRLINYIGLWDDGFLSSISIGVDMFIWFSVLFTISDIFTFVTDIVNIWKKEK